MLTLPPTPPTRNNRATFASLAAAFVDWLVTFVSQLNAQIVAWGSVTYVNRGAWVTATAYNASAILADLVTESSLRYRCLVSHTSGTFATDLAAGKWVLHEVVTHAELADDTGAELVGYLERTVADRLRDAFVSVLDHAAPYDGTDAESQIQAAIDEVAAAGGGAVLVPAGHTFTLAAAAYAGVAAGVASLIIKNGVTLIVEGTLKTKNGAYGAGAFYGMIRSLDAGVSNAAIVGRGTLDGNEANQTASTQCNNVLLECVENIYVGDGLQSINSNGQSIMLRGSVATAAKNIKVLGFTVKNSQSIGLQVSQFDGLVIDDYYIDDCVDNGIDIYGEDGTAVCHGKNFSIGIGTIKNCPVGVFLETVENGGMHGVTTETCTVGVQVNRINGLPRNIDISGNTFRGGSKSAVLSGDYGGGSGVHFHGNTCDDFTAAMVDFQNCVSGTSSDNVAYPATTTTPLYVATSTKVINCFGVRDRVMTAAWLRAYQFVVTGGVTRTGSYVGDLIISGAGYASTYVGVSGNVASGGTFPIILPPDGGTGMLTIYGTAGGGNHSMFTCGVVSDGTNSATQVDYSKAISGSVWVASVAGGAVQTLTVTVAATGSQGSGFWRLDWITA